MFFQCRRFLGIVNDLVLVEDNEIESINQLMCDNNYLYCNALEVEPKENVKFHSLAHIT
jgi:hypothetical protein